ncbi:WD40-repeat-containing domain protein [Rhypophila sp. PSN 637]
MTVDPDMLLPRQTRRQRQVFSSPACLDISPASPTDSGYGSAEPSPASSDSFTPEASEGHLHRLPNELWMLGDGNGSEDLEEESMPSSETDETTRAEYLDEPPSPTIGVAARRMGSIAKRRKPYTLPARSAAHSRPRLPDSFVSESGSKLPRRRSNIALVRSASLRAYDRFIPLRNQSTDTTERYRTGKEWTELTPKERLLRHNGATEDAFCYRRRIVTPMAADYCVLSRSDNAASRRVGNILGPLDQNTGNGSDRQVSRGTIWTVGGLAPGGTAINNGRGQLVRSRTNARLFRSNFRDLNPRQEEGTEKHQDRLAAALGLDRAQRTLNTKIPSYIAAQHANLNQDIPTQWNGAGWVKDGSNSKSDKPVESRTLPAAPFKVLDAPNLRDDFYCSILAYSPTCKMLAVGLGDFLYGWSESGGVKLLNASNCYDGNDHLTSIDFSSVQGGKAILAYGRSNRSLGLMSLLDDPESLSTTGASRGPPLPRFEVDQPAAVTCLSWKPTCTVRPSKCPMTPGRLVETEDLLVGEEAGSVYYYAVEWPEKWEVDRYNWAGAITLLLRIRVHTQQVCGLAWSPSGDLFATGGNDNLCCLYDTAEALAVNQHTVQNELFDSQDESYTRTRTRPDSSEPEDGLGGEGMERSAPQPPTGMIQLPMKRLKAGDEKYRWMHGAAVKAIAFCPWQEGLVATGGGSNDKCIHFFHTTSGAALATISVSAQVTSLIWSKTRREIVATFGYAQPEHPVRIAVFSWPDCRQVAAIPWGGEHRALYAIPYPGGPDDLRAARHGARPRGSSRTAMEGCIMVASSDKSVKFHEVWASDKKATAGGVGMLGGSDILESLEGIDKEGDIIR